MTEGRHSKNTKVLYHSLNGFIMFTIHFAPLNLHTQGTDGRLTSTTTQNVFDQKKIQQKYRAQINRYNDQSVKRHESERNPANPQEKTRRHLTMRSLHSVSALPGFHTRGRQKNHGPRRRDKTQKTSDNRATKHGEELDSTKLKRSRLKLNKGAKSSPETE